jgi:hypothetical protein
MTFLQQASVRLFGLGCFAAAMAFPAVASAQAQSVNCAKASLYRSTGDKKRSAQFAKLCAAERSAPPLAPHPLFARPSALGSRPAPAPNNQGAVQQENQRNAALEARRQQILEQRRQQQLAAQQQQQSQPQQGWPPPQQGQGASLQQIMAIRRQQRQQQLLAQQQLQQQQSQQPQFQQQQFVAPAAPPAPSGDATAPDAPSASDSDAPPAAAGAPAAPIKFTGTGMTLFGAVQLGSALTLPGCGASLFYNLSSGGLGALMGPTINAACVGRRDGVSAMLAARLVRATDVKLAGVDYLLVGLDASKCPDWKSNSGSCVMGVAIKDGVVASVGFYTADDSFEKPILKNLVGKLKAKPSKQSESDCQNNASAQYGLTTRKGQQYFWKVPNMVSSYWTSGGQTCEQGSVVISTQTFEDAIEKSVAKSEDSQPQL